MNLTDTRLTQIEQRLKFVEEALNNFWFDQDERMIIRHRRLAEKIESDLRLALVKERETTVDFINTRIHDSKVYALENRMSELENWKEYLHEANGVDMDGNPIKISLSGGKNTPEATPTCKVCDCPITEKLTPDSCWCEVTISQPAPQPEQETSFESATRLRLDAIEDMVPVSVPRNPNEKVWGEELERRIFLLEHPPLSSSDKGKVAIDRRVAEEWLGNWSELDVCEKMKAALCKALWRCENG